MTDDLKPTFTENALGIPDFSDGSWRMQNKAGAIISSMSLSASPAAPAPVNAGTAPALKR